MSLHDKIGRDRGIFNDVDVLRVFDVKESIQKIKNRIEDWFKSDNGEWLGKHIKQKVNNIIEEEFGKQLTDSKPQANNSQRKKDGTALGKHLETRSKVGEDKNKDMPMDADNHSDTLRGSSEIPKGFKKATCKCGNKYAYCGGDIGYCVECLDKMGDKND